MRILFLNSEAELHNNGGDKILLLTVETLAEDHEVVVLLPLPGPLADAFRTCGIRCEIFRYPIVRRRTGRPWEAILYSLQLVTSTFRLWRYVRRSGIDVVYSNSLGVVQGCLLHMLARIRHIWHIHDMIDRPRLVNCLYSWLVARGADVAICVSRAAHDHLPVRRENLRVVWNGVPPVVDRPGFEHLPGPGTVGVVGRFNGLKGQADMVRASAVLRESGVDLQVRLVGDSYRGDNREREAVRKLIAERELAGVVSVERSVADVATVYAGLDLVVIPSVLLDSFPTVGLEAMSAGKPVVGYASGGLPEMLDFDPDCLAPVGDHRSLAAKIRRFLEHEDFRQQKAREQHARYLENFTVEHYRERIRQALHEQLFPPELAVEERR